MAQRSAHRALITRYRAGAVASWQVFVEKFGYKCFVDALQAQPATVDPARKVADAAYVAGERSDRVVEVCQVQHVCIDVRGEKSLGEPIDAGVLR